MDFRRSKTPFQAVNQYVVKERIGAGGMGTVYLAFDIQLKRHVALKVLNTLDQASLERFVREREITADLDHPNFVRILSMGYLSSKDGLWPFYTMPLLRGETLSSLIRRRIQPNEVGDRLRAEVTLPRLLAVVQQVCLALESAHGRGIIHRDLKPANIVIGPYGEPYIVDLGLAKYLNEEETPGRRDARRASGAAPAGAEDITGPNVVGTLYYMAPEQIENPTTVDARCDVFGMGAILYTILTGHRPLYLPTHEADGDFEIPVENKPAPGNPPEPRKERRRSGRRPEVLPIPHWHEEEEPSSPAERTKFRLQVQKGVLVTPERLAARRRRSTEAILDPVDPALTAICTKALARRPEDRYPSCRAMWQELETYLEGRKELILIREAGDVMRTVSLATLPNALKEYSLAERRLNEKILQRESVGRLGIEEKLDLCDLLLGKAKISERHGNSHSTIRSVTQVEPVIEMAMEVLQRQYIQLLMAKGTAVTQQEDPSSGKAIFERAIALARLHKHGDLVASACCGYGIACAATGDPSDYQDGKTALLGSIAFADESKNLAQAVHSRVGLARLHMSARAKSERARAVDVLDVALDMAGKDPGLLAEVYLAQGESHLGRQEMTLGIRQLEKAMQHAKVIDARNLTWEAHYLLGDAHHTLGHLNESAQHFRKALRIRGPRLAIMERKIAAFCEAHSLVRSSVV